MRDSLLYVLFSFGMETCPRRTLPDHFPFMTNPLYLQSSPSSIGTD